MIKLSLITLLHTLEQSLELNQETNYCIWADCKLLQHSKMQLQVRFQENCTTLEALKMHRTFLKLLTNYSSEKKPSDRTHLLVGHHSANKKWSERNAASFKVIPAAPHALCRGTATSQLHPTRRQNLFYFPPPEIRDQKPYELVFTVSGSNRLENLSTAAGDYMHRAHFHLL